MTSVQSLLDFLLSCTSPLTFEDIVAQVGRNPEEVENDLNQLLAENSLRKRIVETNETDSDGNHIKKCIYWPSSLIPFLSIEPVITSPFQEPFDHNSIFERLTDQQLQQEKIWLQTKLRKLNSDYENLQHRAKKKITEETENEIQRLTDDWMEKTHDMLDHLLSKLKEHNPDMNMSKLLEGLRIDPDFVKWDPEEECFK